MAWGAFSGAWRDDEAMSRRRTVYEGKAKVLYEGPEPGTLIQYFKDDTTAFDAKKRAVLEGKGVASRLVKTALDDARIQHLAVVPFCPFVASFLRRHPDDNDLVHPDDRHLIEDEPREGQNG